MRVVGLMMTFAGRVSGSFRVGCEMVSFLGVRGVGSGGWVWHIASASAFPLTVRSVSRTFAGNPVTPDYGVYLLN